MRVFDSPMIQDNTKELIGAMEAACRKRLTKADGRVVPLTRQAEKVQFRGWGPNFESDITEVPDRVATMFALDESLRGTPEMLALQTLMSSKEQVFQRARDPTAAPIPAEHSLSQARYWIIADIVDGILTADASHAIIERVSEKFEATFLLERPYLVEFPVINLRIEGDVPLVLDARLRLRKLEAREREDLVTYASIFHRMDVETVGHIEWALEIRFDLDPSGPTMYIQSNRIAQAVLT